MCAISGSADNIVLYAWNINPLGFAYRASMFYFRFP